MEGKINSFQSMGAVDGPGIRFVVFMQGCPLRCVYCHNPDTWSLEGQEYTVNEVFQRILRYKPYFGENGGVTVSGGEPLLQWEFVSELLSRLKEEGIHTALDTSGTGSIHDAAEVLKYTDLVLCDLKFSTNESYRQYCNGSLDQTLNFLKLTEQKQVPLWIRHVVVPGLTDDKESLTCIARLAKQFSNLAKFELLPFRKLCLAKYEVMGIPFPLADHEDCSDETIKKLTGELG
ncbi:MAG TPA: pyruvate formate-lyase-activating protein [Anaerovoracaceae bacterium]|nr:pyruvate formate-lyase-activating protein [Anaerovoracaceae bacterium]